MHLQLHLLSLAAHCHDPDAGLVRASSLTSTPPPVRPAATFGPKAALALEHMVTERIRGMTELDLGGARLTDGQAAALAALLPCFSSGLERLCVTGA